jgi:hypothetical protein
MRVWYVRRAGAQRAAGAGAPSGATCDVSKCDGRERSERPEQEHRQVRLATFRSATGGSGVRLAEGQEHRQVRLATVGTAGGRVYRVIRRLLSVKRPVRWTVVAIASGGGDRGGGMPPRTYRCSSSLRSHSAPFGCSISVPPEHRTPRQPHPRSRYPMEIRVRELAAQLMFEHRWIRSVMAKVPGVRDLDDRSDGSLEPGVNHTGCQEQLWDGAEFKTAEVSALTIGRCSTTGSRAASTNTPDLYTSSRRTTPYSRMFK